MDGPGGACRCCCLARVPEEQVAVLILHDLDGVSIPKSFIRSQFQLTPRTRACGWPGRPSRRPRVGSRDRLNHELAAALRDVSEAHAAEGARDDGGEIADPDALLRSDSRDRSCREWSLARARLTTLARRPLVWLAAPLWSSAPGRASRRPRSSEAHRPPTAMKRGRPRQRRPGATRESTEPASAEPSRVGRAACLASAHAPALAGSTQAFTSDASAVELSPPPEAKRQSSRLRRLGSSPGAGASLDAGGDRGDPTRHSTSDSFAQGSRRIAGSSSFALLCSESHHGGSSAVRAIHQGVSMVPPFQARSRASSGGGR